MTAGHAPFALWNRSGNRLVALALRSPLRSLLGRQLALITVTGRRSGREYTFPVSYERAGERVTIPVMWPQRKLWWRNLRGGAPVRLSISRKELTGQGTAHEDDQGAVSVEVLLD